MDERNVRPRTESEDLFVVLRDFRLGTQLSGFGDYNVGVVFMYYRVTIKTLPGPDFPGARGDLIA